MTYSFKINYQTDSDIPGDSGKRTKTVHVDAENMDDACEYVSDKYSNDQEFDGYELINS